MKYKSIGVNAFLNILKQCSNLLFPLITFPYVSRVLGSSGYGKYNFAYSIVGYFALIAALGIPTYAVREGAKVRDNKEEINKLSSEIFTLNLIVTILSFILLGIFLITFNKFKSYTELIIILSTSILFTTIGVDWINTIFEDYVFIVVRDLIFKVIAVVLMLLLVKNPEDYVIYALITALAESGKNILNFFYVRKYVNLHIVKNINLKKHIVPILILFCNALTITIYVNSDITLIGLFLNDSEVGIYSTSSKVYSMCKSVLNAIVLVFIPRMSYLVAKNNKSEYDNILNKMLNTLIVIIFPAVVLINLFSGEIIRILGGTEYASGAMSLKILSISIVFAILTSFYSNSILIPNRKDKEYFFATLEAAIINVGLNFIAIPYLGVNGAALTTLIAEMVVMIQVIRYSKKLHGDINVMSSIVTSFISCIGIMLVCKACNIIFNNMYVYLIISIIISGIVYLALQIILKNKIVINIVDKILLKIGACKNDRFKKVS